MGSEYSEAQKQRRTAMTKLKTIREAAGLSQTQLAAKAGVPVRMVRAYEAEAETARKDINKAAAMTVWRLAQALGCCVGDLIE